MKIVVIGDIVVPCDLLVEAAKKLDQDAEVVAVEWKSETRQDQQQRKYQTKHTSRLLMQRFC